MKSVELLQETIKAGASDLHLTVGRPPTIRLNGDLVTLDYPSLTPNDLNNFAKEIIPEKYYQLFQNRGEVDLSHSLEGIGRFRVNAFHQRGQSALVLRTIPYRIPSLDELLIPTEVKEMARLPRGLFLVTGPTGSGKSTTLAAMVDQINSERSCHIVTIEDPIEYLHSHKKSIVNQREIGSDTRNFPQALRAALRQDPDVLLIGEMRDLETISTAITAAETGHLVLATLHTNSAAQTIDRIIDVFPPHQQQQIRVQLAATLQGVLVQQLLPRIDKPGRIVATEFLLVNTAVRNLIREGKTHQIQSILQTNGRYGMHTMDMSLKRLYSQGKIRFEEAAQKAIDKDAFIRLLEY